MAAQSPGWDSSIGNILLLVPAKLTAQSGFGAFNEISAGRRDAPRLVRAVCTPWYAPAGLRRLAPQPVQMLMDSADGISEIAVGLA